MASVIQSRQGTATWFSEIFLVQVISTSVKHFGTALPEYAVQHN